MSKHENYLNSINFTDSGQTGYVAVAVIHPNILSVLQSSKIFVETFCPLLLELTLLVKYPWILVKLSESEHRL